MKTYLVGGAVRDQLIGLPVKDRDWVVVGATPDDMLAKGFKQVGADFPVFLHPETGEEFALARTERKTAAGYRGFQCQFDSGVTLEEDLTRRDLTINAIAQDANGALIDPTGGQADIQARLFRHVGPAFSEDPVRILRIARFAARHPDFTVHPSTVALMASMVDAGEVDALVPERIWKELSRGLMEVKPSRMLEVLRECGALKRIIPELDRLWGVPQPLQWHPEGDTGVHVGMVVDHAAKIGADLPTRFAALMHDLGKGTTHPQYWPKHHGHEARSAELVLEVCERMKIPVECRGLAELVGREHGSVHASLELRATAVGRLLNRCDAFRQPERFEKLMLACECDARGRLGLENRLYPQSDRLRKALSDALAVDTKAVSAECLARGMPGVAIGEKIYRARLTAIAEGLKEDPSLAAADAAAEVATEEPGEGAAPAATSKRPAP